MHIFYEREALSLYQAKTQTTDEIQEVTDEIQAVTDEIQAVREEAQARRRRRRRRNHGYFVTTSITSVPSIFSVRW